ncbi:hypothetical protein L3X38_025537 [Prunus dulcis]|uniref:Transposable element protein n=1 Tax=Prunus dulcis TaxID=3755 RepID=A0AAD4W3H5_PRUDU|nr:hypothetical protein L3X38_025537 [Prunus dulcis]
MDGSSGYNQIRMSPEDEELTAFQTPKGIYCYKAMPFGLKNVGATYQRAMQKIFGDMLCKNVECYVDDLVIKSQIAEIPTQDEPFEVCLQRHVSPELNYTPIDKTYLALVFAIQKLRHYMQSFMVHLIAQVDPVRYVMSKPVLTRPFAKWASLLNLYEIIYTPAKAIKGQVVADFLADHPILADWEILDDLPDEQVFFAYVSSAWMMFFDGSARKDRVGAGVVFVSPKRHVLPYSLC